MTVFRVIQPGPLTTIQDGGRKNMAHLGMSEGGPMDFRSFALANRLVGNSIQTAALEITFGGLELECLAKTTLAVSGAFCPIFINRKAVPMWQTHTLNSGDKITIGFAGVGTRAYLSVCGGFDSPEWFGSQSVVIRENLGNRLEKDDILKGHACSQSPALKLDYRHQPSLRNHAQLSFVPGYQWAEFPVELQTKFAELSFKISNRNDRMGYQLEGEALKTGIQQLYSEGICAGAIQIAGDGQPIILMRDRQTIGGYPKAGSVTKESLDSLAQLRSGNQVQFKPISPERALSESRRYLELIQTLPLLPL